MQARSESPDLQPAPDTEPAAGKEAEPTPSALEAPDTTPGLRPDSASDDESGTAGRQTYDTPATAGEDERLLSAATAFADTPEELAARQATEAAAREAADRATAESGVGSRLKAEAGRILAAYPDAPVVYMTSNGFGFFRESEARNHAATLRDKAVITVKRK
jgi:hypothetical protein